MITVVIQAKGADFLPIATPFSRYSEAAEWHIVAEAMRTPPHKTENVVVEKILSSSRTGGT